MIGKGAVRQIQQPKFETVLSYTGVAMPLNMEGIIADLNEWATESVRGGTPEKIVLWEHQRDWLKKTHDKNYGRIADAFQVPTYQAVGQSVVVDTIMGIPLEILS